MKPCETAPYGKRKWCMGNIDDFICLDWCGFSSTNITLHAVVVNSETGGLPEDFDKDTVPTMKAGNRAQSMVDAAWEWLIENKVKMTEKDIEKSEAAAGEFLEEIYIEPYVDRRPI